jgi:glycosyltransferase involved in cell wall biosynthesis
MPRFSIVIPTRNRIDLLVKTLASVRAQTFRDFEVIIVDDFSDDPIVARIHGLDASIRVIPQAFQSGPSAARNAGIMAAMGDYIAFLDDDDLWMPWTLQTYADVIVQSEQPAWLTSNGFAFVGPDDLLGVTRGRPDIRSFDDYLNYRTNPDQPGWLLPTGVAIRRDLLQAIGGFDPSITHHEDEDLWLRLGDSPGFIRIAAPLCWAYRSHAGGASLNLPRRFSNIHRLIAKEQAGGYPGGADRQRQRIDILTQLGRNLARLGARDGHYGQSWRMYCTLAIWNLRLARWRFLVLFPPELLAHALRGLATRRARLGVAY